MRKTIQQLAILGIVLVLVGMTACSQKRKPLVPLVLDNEVKAQAAALTEQGTQAYQCATVRGGQTVFRASGRGGSAIRAGPLQLCAWP